MGQIQNVSVKFPDSIFRQTLPSKRGMMVCVIAPRVVQFDGTSLSPCMLCWLQKIVCILCGVIQVTEAYVELQDWEKHLQHGTLKDMVAPRLQKKIVMQQIREAAAAGLDADLIKDVSVGRRQQSFAKLAENDDMVDL